MRAKSNEVTSIRTCRVFLNDRYEHWLPMGGKGTYQGEIKRTTEGGQVVLTRRMQDCGDSE